MRLPEIQINKARIQGVSSQMNTFNFLFGTYLGELVLRHTDNLSKTLQHQSLLAAEGKIVADMVIQTIKNFEMKIHLICFG